MAQKMQSAIKGQKQRPKYDDYTTTYMNATFYICKKTVLTQD